MIMKDTICEECLRCQRAKSCWFLLGPCGCCLAGRFRYMHVCYSSTKEGHIQIPIQSSLHLSWTFSKQSTGKSRLSM
jgi:hypothetical protein